MVSEQGAKAAQPIVTEIDKLEGYIAQLEAAANPGTSTIWKMEIQVYVNGVSTTILLIDNLNAADSTALLFDVRNILGTKLAVEQNALGAIT